MKGSHYGRQPQRPISAETRWSITIGISFLFLALFAEGFYLSFFCGWGGVALVYGFSKGYFERILTERDRQIMCENAKRSSDDFKREQDYQNYVRRYHEFNNPSNGRN
ncbi:hypothetical protein [Vibrio xiamenensis]|uniref:hypothetical protein n=1 Tax=Vibrio xiamenensis TaxID=861298 RepID=UPI00115F9B5C|nr:hypothetical protein [Vibrio xiamenensis]